MRELIISAPSRGPEPAALPSEIDALPDNAVRLTAEVLVVAGRDALARNDAIEASFGRYRLVSSLCGLRGGASRIRNGGSDCLARKPPISLNLLSLRRATTQGGSSGCYETRLKAARREELEVRIQSAPPRSPRKLEAIGTGGVWMRGVGQLAHAISTLREHRQDRQVNKKMHASHIKSCRCRSC